MEILLNLISIKKNYFLFWKFYILEIFFIFLIFIFLLIFIAFFTLAERKIMGNIQRRQGPSFFGFGGLLQPIADAGKLIQKETILPIASFKYLFILSSISIFFLSLINWLFIPFNFYGSFLNSEISLLIILAFSSLSVYAIIFAGWASNSKYAFLGAIRASAQMLSYDIVWGVSTLPLVLFSGSTNIEIIFKNSFSYPFLLWYLPFALIFFICSLAETNRTPFDLPEAEGELVAGYNVEFSSFLFALFFLAEYSNMGLIISLFVILFWNQFLFNGLISFINWIFSQSSFLDKYKYIFFNNKNLFLEKRHKYSNKELLFFKKKVFFEESNYDFIKKNRFFRKLISIFTMKNRTVEKKYCFFNMRNLFVDETTDFLEKNWNNSRIPKHILRNIIKQNNFNSFRNEFLFNNNYKIPSFKEEIFLFLNSKIYNNFKETIFFSEIKPKKLMKFFVLLQETSSFKRYEKSFTFLDFIKIIVHNCTKAGYYKNDLNLNKKNIFNNNFFLMNYFKNKEKFQFNKNLFFSWSEKTIIYSLEKNKLEIENKMIKNFILNPILDFNNLFLQTLSISIKIIICSFIYIFIRAILPRYRYDQLLFLCWKFLLIFIFTVLFFYLICYLFIYNLYFF